VINSKSLPVETTETSNFFLPIKTIDIPMLHKFVLGNQDPFFLFMPAWIEALDDFIYDSGVLVSIRLLPLRFGLFSDEFL